MLVIACLGLEMLWSLLSGNVTSFTLGKLEFESESRQLCSLVMYIQTTHCSSMIRIYYLPCPCHGQYRLSLLYFTRPISVQPFICDTCACCYALHTPSMVGSRYYSLVGYQRGMLKFVLATKGSNPPSCLYIPLYPPHFHYGGLILSSA